MPHQIIPIPNSPAFVSYRPADITPLPVSGDFNSCETALVHGTNFMILSGDFRCEVGKIISSYEKDAHKNLIAFFEDKSLEWASSWSSEVKVRVWVDSRGLSRC